MDQKYEYKFVRLGEGLIVVKKEVLTKQSAAGGSIKTGCP